MGVGGMHGWTPHPQDTTHCRGKEREREKKKKREREGKKRKKNQLGVATLSSGEG